jgi:hypothetical protein
MSNMGEGPLARFTRVKHPVARDEDLLVEELTDETVVYDNRTKEAHCLSPLAAVVFANCDGRTTIEQLSTLATERLGEPVDESRVVEALAQLQERDLLAVPPRDGFSRRQMIGRSAAAAGGAFAGASLITSILAPAAIAANSATCADILCCPCCTGGTFSDKACCSAPSTVSCQCSGATRADNPAGKFCKPSGNNYFTDQICQSIYDQTGYKEACVPKQSYTAAQSVSGVAGAGLSCRTCT